MLHYIMYDNVKGKEGIRNQTEPAGAERGTEPKRTESDRTMTRSKSAGRTASNRTKTIAKPNRTKAILFNEYGTETSRTKTGSFLMIVTIHDWRCECMLSLWSKAGGLSSETIHAKQP